MNSSALAMPTISQSANSHNEVQINYDELQASQEQEETWTPNNVIILYACLKFFSQDDSDQRLEEMREMLKNMGQDIKENHENWKSDMKKKFYGQAIEVDEEDQ